MGFDPLSIGLTLASTAASYSAQRASADAQEAAAEYEADLLDQQAENERNARIENTRRQQDNADRFLSEVFVQSANSGTVTGAGTSRLLLEEIESRIDSDLDNFTEAAQAQVGRIENAATMTRWQGNANAAATRLQSVGTLFKGTALAASQFHEWRQDQTPSPPQAVRPYQTPSPPQAVRPYSLF